jgi:hypothetical protein
MSTRHNPTRHSATGHSATGHGVHSNSGVPTNVRRRRSWLAGAAIAGAAAIGLPAIASAARAPSDPEPGSQVPPALQERIDVLCARVPNLQTRTNNLIVRLESSVETRGSLAWLADLVNKARTNGREDLAVVLENRLAVRTATLEVLKLRVDALADAAVFCEGRGE